MARNLTAKRRAEIKLRKHSPDTRQQIFLSTLNRSREMRLLRCQGDSVLGRQRFYSEKIDVRHDSPFYRFKGVLTGTNLNISDNSDAWKHIDELEKELQGLKTARSRGMKGRGHLHRIEALEQKIKFVEQGML